MARSLVDVVAYTGVNNEQNVQFKSQSKIFWEFFLTVCQLTSMNRAAQETASTCRQSFSVETATNGLARNSSKARDASMPAEIRPWFIVPAFLALVVALVIVLGAFSAKADLAVQFFGSFTAAIVAAVAVVLGARVEHRLTRDRDNETRRTEIIERHNYLYGHLHHALDVLGDIKDLFAVLTYNVAPGAQPQPTDFAHLEAVNWRRAIPTVECLPIERVLEWSTGLPVQLAQQIRRANSLIVRSASIVQLPALGEQTPLQRGTVVTMINLVTMRIGAIQAAITALENYLRESGELA